MISKDDINKLAELARLAVKEEEKDKLLSDLEGVLGYVAELEEVSADLNLRTFDHEPSNIMREDEGGHLGGEYTEDLLSGSPSREGDYFAVKKIF